MPDKGGALLFISKGLNYKAGSNLQIHKEKELESIFIEVLSKSHKLLNEKKNNVDLLHYETHSHSREILDNMF